VSALNRGVVCTIFGGMLCQQLVFQDNGQLKGRTVAGRAMVSDEKTEDEGQRSNEILIPIHVINSIPCRLFIIPTKAEDPQLEDSSNRSLRDPLRLLVVPGI
jgi:hypothetical protein